MEKGPSMSSYSARPEALMLALLGLPSMARCSSSRQRQARRARSAWRGLTAPSACGGGRAGSHQLRCNAQLGLARDVMLMLGLWRHLQCSPSLCSAMCIVPLPRRRRLNMSCHVLSSHWFFPLLRPPSTHPLPGCLQLVRHTARHARLQRFHRVRKRLGHLQLRGTRTGYPRASASATHCCTQAWLQ